MRGTGLKDIMKKTAMLLGAVIWIGALSPEIFIKAGEGCIFDEDGRALTQEEAEEFMESYFYGNAQEDEEVTITYKIALFDFFKK